VAEHFAKENKNRLVEGYLARQNGRMFTLLEEFYEREPRPFVYFRKKKKRP
jgi:hypothetical protein